MPCPQDRAEQQEVNKLVPRFDGPDFEALPREQLVHQIGRRHKAKPEHKPSQRA